MSSSYFRSPSQVASTQQWEHSFDNGNLAVSCFPSLCTLTATAQQSANAPTRAVDTDSASFYQSVASSGAFWQVELHNDTFVSSVKVCPPASQPSALDLAWLGISETGVSGSFFEYPFGSLRLCQW